MYTHHVLSPCQLPTDGVETNEDPTMPTRQTRLLNRHHTRSMRHVGMNHLETGPINSKVHGPWNRLPWCPPP